MSNEIGRLRKLRQTALDTRVLAQLLHDAEHRDSAAARAAVLCWRIARTATAQLRAHPHQAFHSDPGLLEAAVGLLRALRAAIPALYRKRPFSALQAELLGLTRVLDDVRALTLSPDLSDALGRSQAIMRHLMDEIGAGARGERGWRPELQGDAPLAMAPNAAQASSPYLAL